MVDFDSFSSFRFLRKKLKNCFFSNTCLVVRCNGYMLPLLKTSPHTAALALPLSGSSWIQISCVFLYLCHIFLLFLLWSLSSNAISAVTLLSCWSRHLFQENLFGSALFLTLFSFLSIQSFSSPCTGLVRTSQPDYIADWPVNQTKKKYSWGQSYFKPIFIYLTIILFSFNLQ